ncbi:hypothetical protein [Sphaerisporangium dianthi]|uniref:Uncharacterized protein n=1 Tax=Sphaerisporangium dianthi TaxID=1436120 RepID=A0ABV9CNM0_9ACTN
MSDGDTPQPQERPADDASEGKRQPSWNVPEESPPRHASPESDGAPAHGAVPGVPALPSGAGDAGAVPGGNPAEGGRRPDGESARPDPWVQEEPVEGPQTASEDEASLRDNTGEESAARRMRAETWYGRDWVAGDVTNNYYGSERERLTQAGGPLSASVLAECDRVHALTASDRRLRDRLRREPLVFLNKRAGTGRRSSGITALYGLPQRGRPAARVNVLDGAGGLRAVMAELLRGQGHLVDASGMGWVRELGEAQIGQLVKRLTEIEATLIVLTDEPDGSELPWPPDNVVWHVPPQPLDVVAHHIAAGVYAVDGHVDRQALDRAGRLVSDAVAASPAARSWYEEMTSGASTTPRAAVQFARAIAQWALQDRKPDLDVLISVYRDAQLVELARRLLRESGESDSPLHQSYVLASAVLDRLPVTEVINAARALADRLYKVERPTGTTGRKVFGDPLPTRLRHLTLGPAGNGGPAAGAFSVRMPEPRLARALLWVVWNDYDSARTPLLHWLMEVCAGARTLVTQVRCAQSLAIIAAEDYDVVYQEVLKPWSHSRDLKVHRGAAWLIEALMATWQGEGEQDKVMRLRARLRRWSRSGEWQQQAVAIRAYGTRIATWFPEDATEALRIAAADPWERFDSLVEHALVEMYLQGLEAAVLGEMCLWKAFVPMRAQAARTWVRLARLRSRPSNGAPGRDHTIQCRLAEMGEDFCLTADAHASLWALACSQPESIQEAWRVLSRWEARGRVRPELRESFADLVRRLELDPQMKDQTDRLRSYRRMWVKRAAKNAQEEQGER